MAFTLIDDPLLHLCETHNALLCSMQARFSESLIRNIGELGAKNYFTDHRTANTMSGFGDSVPVLTTIPIQTPGDTR